MTRDIKRFFAHRFKRFTQVACHQYGVEARCAAVNHIEARLSMQRISGVGSGEGVVRDMFQNHLLQLMALTAMEEPLSFAADDVRAEKEKLLRAVSLPRELGKHTSRGQYASGWQGGIPVKGYLEEDGVNPLSQTETYAAFRVDIDNRRWAGVPGRRWPWSRRAASR